MGRVKELTKENFFQEITKPSTILVDFWAPWCGPCRAIAPELESLAATMEGKAVVAKVNVDDDPELAQEFGVQSIPNLIVFRDGRPVRQMVGFHDRTQLAAALA